MPPVAQPTMVRLERSFHVEPNTGCWLWLGHLATGGYGSTPRMRDGRWVSARAHRVVYEEVRGPIPDGLELDHLCHQRCCVNPDHLEPVTHQENVRRATVYRRGATCKRGHLRTAHSVSCGGGKYFRCKACHRDIERQRYQRARAGKTGA